MKINYTLFIIIFLMLSFSLNAQIVENTVTFEIEPNDDCSISNVNTISSNGSFGGQLPLNDVDVWKLELGISGDLTLTVDLWDGVVSIYVVGANVYCANHDESYWWLNGQTGPRVIVMSNLKSSRQYSIFVYGHEEDDGLAINSITDYQFTLTGGALPVELTTFSANLLDNKVELIWNTATEVNNYGFEIQRSAVSNQRSEFEKIGFVDGHGNSNSPKYYSFTDKSIEASGKYSYRLKQVDIDGTFEYSDEVEVDLGLPKDYTLEQNYPNPFNPSTSISYSIPNDGNVTLSIYDVIGNEVAVLENGYKTAGNYSHNF